MKYDNHEVAACIRQASDEARRLCGARQRLVLVASMLCPAVSCRGELPYDVLLSVGETAAVLTLTAVRVVFRAQQQLHPSDEARRLCHARQRLAVATTMLTLTTAVTWIGELPYDVLERVCGALVVPLYVGERVSVQFYTSGPTLFVHLAHRDGSLYPGKPVLCVTAVAPLQQRCKIGYHYPVASTDAEGALVQRVIELPLGGGPSQRIDIATGANARDDALPPLGLSTVRVALRFAVQSKTRNSVSNDEFCLGPAYACARKWFCVKMKNPVTCWECVLR